MSDVDYNDNVVDLDAQRAEMNLRSLEKSDPQKAIRAYRLSQATGYPPHMVMDNLEEVEREHKANLGGKLVSYDDIVAKYLNSHELAPAISQNDLGNLSQTSEKMQEWHARKHENAWQPFIDVLRQAIPSMHAEQYTTWGAAAKSLSDLLSTDTARSMALSTSKAIESSIGTQAQGVGYLTGDEGFKHAKENLLQSSESQLKESMGEEEYNKLKKQGEETISGQVAGGAGSLIGLLPGLMGGGMFGGALEMGLVSGEEMRSRAAEKGGSQGKAFTYGGASGFAFGLLPLHMLTKATTPLAAGALSWSMAKLQQAGLMGGIMGVLGEFQQDVNESIARLLFDPQAQYEPDAQRFLASFMLGGLLGGAFGRVKPFVDKNEPIPPGIDPTIDKTKQWQAEHDGERAKELMKEVQKDETRELDPDLYAKNFLGQHGDSSIRINIEAVRALYGDKTPTTDDGILGHILPDLGDTLRLADETGGHVEVSFNDWLAKVDPKVANDLHDDVVYRPGGISINEGKALEDYHKAQEAALKAPKAVAARPEIGKITLEHKKGLEPAAEAAGVDTFHLKDGDRKIGYMHVKYNKDAKTILIDMISALSGAVLDPSERGLRFGQKALYNTLGMKNIKGILEQLKEAYPEAEKITGYRVGGARDKAGKPGVAEMPLAKMSAEDFMKILKEVQAEQDAQVEHPGLPQGEEFFHEQIQGNTWVALRKTDLFTQIEDHLSDFIQNEVDQMSGQTVEAGGVHGIEHEGEKVAGLYHTYDKGDQLPLILYSLAIKDPYGIARHEIIHHLRRLGFFTGDEWSILEHAAEEGGWIKKHDIDTRYADGTYEYQLEEAIAEEFRHWGRSRPLGHPAYTAFEKMRAFFAKIRAKTIELTGLKEITADDLFARVETGEIGKRGVGGGGFWMREYLEFYDAVREQAGIAPAAKEDAPFKTPGAIGLDAKENRKLMGLWNKRKKEDIKASQKAAEDLIKRQNSAEWKRRRQEVRDEVTNDIKGRPDFLVDNVLRQMKEKLNAEMLTDEQKKMLPKQYYGKDGLNPDDLARAVGYQSGEAMVNNFAMLVNKRGRLPPKEFEKLEIEKLTEQRMKRRYGDPDAEAMEQAKDHVLSETQMDLIHEQTLALGEQAGVKIQITKKQVKDYTKDLFDRTRMAFVKANDFLNLSGKAERGVRMALMDENFSEAYRQHQAKQYSLLYAKYAKELTKEMGRFNKIASRYAKRDVEGVDPEVAAFIQQTLDRFEVPLQEKAKDFNERIAEFREGANPKYKDFQDFVDKQWAGEPDPPIADFLYDPSFKKPIKDLTVEEFEALSGSLKAMAKKASDKYKIRLRDKEENRAELIHKMTSRMAELFEEQPYRPDLEQGAISKLAKSYWANQIILETIWNRFDKNNAKGLFNQTLSIPFARAANNARMLMLDAGKMFRELPVIREMNKAVDNPWFREAIGRDENGKLIYGNLMSLSRNNVLAILQNMGNPQNWYGLLDGYGIPRNKSGEVMDWVWKNTTKEDVQRAKGLGNIFNWAFGHASTARREMYDYAPPKVKTWTVRTPWGDFDGWYHKISYDKGQAQSIASLTDPAHLLERAYNRTSPSASYAKERTGAKGPYTLNLDMAPQWANEMLYDSAMKQVLHEGSKILKDTNFRQSLTKRLGAHYTDLLDPYIKDVANRGAYDSDAQNIAVRSLEFIRTNVMSHLVGLNPATFFKHNLTALMNSATEVGAKEFWKEALHGQFADYQNGESGRQFALANSAELAPRHVNWVDTISGAHAQVYGQMRTGMTGADWAANWKNRGLYEGMQFAGRQLKGQYLAARQHLMWIEAGPLAWGDLWSAIPTWLVAYKAEMARGSTHDNAADLADRAVRRAHGSTVVTNRPGLMRTNPWLMSFSSFYGFFNHILQRQYEFAWAVKELSKGGEYYAHPDEILKMVEDKSGAYQANSTYKTGLAATAPMAGMLVSYFLYPALVEMAVGGFDKDKNESKLGFWAKHQLGFQASSLLYVRDIVHALVHHADPSSGMFGEAVKNIYHFASDTSRLPNLNTREKQQMYLRHANSAFSTITGLSNNSIVRAGIFHYNWFNNKERVNDFEDWWKGTTHGTVKPQRRH